MVEILSDAAMARRQPAGSGWPTDSIVICELMPAHGAGPLCNDVVSGSASTLPAAWTSGLHSALPKPLSTCTWAGCCPLRLLPLMVAGCLAVTATILAADPTDRLVEGLRHQVGCPAHILVKV